MRPLEDSPAWFAWYHLGLDLYPKQVEALESVGMGVMNGAPPTSVVAGNGSGKTQRIIAPAILWFLWRYPRGWCPVTSGSWLQVEKQLFPALHTFRSHPLFRKWTFNQTEIRTDQGGQAVGFSTDSPGRAEGWHPKISMDEDPVFYITDEAKTVPDGIFDAIGRCTLRFQLLASSPGAPRGKFYRSHTSEASEHRCIKITSEDCAHISREKIERDRRLYGDDHPIFRSMHLAEFTEDAERLVISTERLTRALQSQPEKNETGETVAFCDFAAGGDENVLAIRRGNSVKVAKHWKEKDTMQAAREFVNQFKIEGLEPGQIWGDADGLGTVMIDAIAELGFRINRFHGGQKAMDSTQYANLIGEVWINGCREIERGRIHLGQIEPELFRQLTTRKTEWADNGKLRVESKEKMRAAGIHSPDRADAVLGCIICGSHMTGALTADKIEAMQVEANPFGGSVMRW
jgi:phage terminase large subunit